MWRKKKKSKNIRINPKSKSTSFKIISTRKIILYKSVRIKKINIKKNSFYDFSNVSNGNVILENFPKLLGIFGTDIANNFANRIFEVFSSNKDYITLLEYLKYIDIYHYGDKIERCKVTCKLMDFSNTGIIRLNDFKKYIQLIIGAVKKVNPGLQNDLFNDEDISILFNKISNNREYFTYEDFKSIYNDKPEILSWIDYFKNDSNEFILFIHQYIKNLINVLFNYNTEIVKIINLEIKKGNDYKNFEPNNLLNNLRNIINNMQKELKKYDNEFMKYAKFNQFSMRNLFDNLSNDNVESDLSENDSDSDVDEKKDNIINTGNNILKSNKFISVIRTKLNKKENYINLFFENLKKKINDYISDEEKKEDDDELLPIKHKSNSKNSLISKKSETSKNYINDNKTFNIEEKSSSDDSDFEIIEDDNSDFIANMNSLNKGNEENTLIKKISDTFSNEQNNNANQKEKEFKKPIINDRLNNELKKKQYKSYKYIFKCIEYFCKKVSKSIYNIEESYIWIENHYLKKTLKEVKKKQIEKKNNNIIKKEKELPTNIPKNKLKTTDYSFKILLNTIMGIQIAVESTPNINKINDINQYLTSLTYSIQTINLSKDKQESFLLKEYAGIIFNDIRKFYGFEKENFIQSISPQEFITEMIISSSTSIEELFSTGRSGSLFYYTRDGKFILKTISKDEYKTLKSILPSYYNHLMKYKKSYLPKFFGCYKLIRKVKKEYNYVYFIIMVNIFETKNTIHVTFDIKGSKIGRRVLEENNNEDINKIYGKYSYSLKDCDLDRMKKLFYIENNLRNDIIKQLKEDSIFLRNCNFNDYSLLVGIHRLNFNKENKIYNKANEIELEEISTSLKKSNKALIDEDTFNLENNNFNIENSNILLDGGIKSENNEEIYYIGIIDILTNYNCKKTIEYIFKKIRYCSNTMSCVPPSDYQERFIQYMKTKFVSLTNDNNNSKSIFDSRKNNLL